MGNRFLERCEKAMRFLHRYLENPVLTTIGRLFFGHAAEIFTAGRAQSAKTASFASICGRQDGIRQGDGR